MIHQFKYLCYLIRLLVASLVLINIVRLVECANRQEVNINNQPNAILNKLNVLDRENFNLMAPPLWRRASSSNVKSAERENRTGAGDGGGQLESFSMEATGLGDLEEADALRRMVRRHLFELSNARRQQQQQHQKSSLMEENKHQLLRNKLKLYLRSALKSLRLRERMRLTQLPFARLVADQTLPVERFDDHLTRIIRNPIETRSLRLASRNNKRNNPTTFLISRRSSGPMNTATSQEETLEIMPLDDELQLNDSYGSPRFSLLTTRKLQPEETSILLDGSNIDLDATMPDTNNLLASNNQVHLLLKGAANNDNDDLDENERVNEDKNDRAGEQMDEDAVVIGTGSNYLPRFARAFN